MDKVVFIIPMYNAISHIPELVDSLKEQINDSWEAVFIDDMSTDGSSRMIKICSGGDERFKVVRNKEKKWALKNFIEAARLYQEDDVIIANVDADDSLCNENTVDLLISAYDSKTDAVWTSHSWDINGMNISKSLPKNINPYHYPWCSSHLKTFRSTILQKICNKNFQDLDGEWFKRGYDQALYLPVLYKSRGNKFLDEVCYLYRINSNSLKVRDWNEKTQLDTVRLVRARGFVNE